MRELRELLLRSGISSAAVRRYLDELANHREDLMEELSAAGLTPDQAAVEADRRLGDVNTLAQPMLADRRFHSFARRAPMLVLVGAPLAAQAASVALLATVVILAVRGGQLPQALVVPVGVLQFLTPLAIGCALLWWIIRRRISVAWAMAGLVTTVVLGAVLQLEIQSDAVAVSLAAPDLLRLAAHGWLVVIPLCVRELRLS